jgi:hypothetical protein
MWHVLRWSLVVLLLATAAIKLAAIGQLLHGGGLLSDPRMIGLAVGFELAAAASIGLARDRLAHWIALATFAMFSLIAGADWLTGQDCNCFGPHTTRGLPLLIDVACLIALAWVRPLCKPEPAPGETIVGHSRHRLLPYVVFTAMIVGGATWLWASRVESRQSVPSWFGEQLIGKRFPLLKFAEVDALIPDRGQVTVMFLRPDCEHCHEFASQWNVTHAEDEELRRRVLTVSMAIGQWTVMPRVVSAAVAESPENVELTWTADTEPFVAAPTVIQLNNSVVTQVESGDLKSLHSATLE